jgi:plastocyanin
MRRSLRTRTWLLVGLALAAPAGLSAFANAEASAMTSGAGAAQTVSATISGGGFDPTRITVLTGDTVSWHDTGGTHTVTSTTSGFASGTLSFNQTFSHRFGDAGSFPYYCSIHRYMTGEIDVADILLGSVPSLAAPDHTLALSGRTALALAAGSQVTIQADTGTGFVPVTTATVADGTFTANVTPRTTTTYRAVSGAMTSPTVRVPVTDHKVTITAAHEGKRDLVRVSVHPAAPRATVVLQLNLRERFGWWPVQQKTLDRSSRASFLVRPPYRALVRVVLTLPDGATQLAVSKSQRITP